MWLKKLFTIPEGKKITEKIFSRILVSSICSILLCMSCLFGMTWAWFAVDIVNQGNVIQIAEVTVNTEVRDSNGAVVTKKENGSYELPAGIYKVNIAVNKSEASADAFGSTPTMYVVVTVGYTKYYVASVPVEQEFELTETAVVTFAPSWINPANDRVSPLSALDPSMGVISAVSEEETTEGETEENTEATEKVTEMPTDPPAQTETTVPTEAPTEFLEPSQ